MKLLFTSILFAATVSLINACGSSSTPPPATPPAVSTESDASTSVSTADIPTQHSANASGSSAALAAPPAAPTIGVIPGQPVATNTMGTTTAPAANDNKPTGLFGLPCLQVLKNMFHGGSSSSSPDTTSPSTGSTGTVGFLQN